MELTFSSTQFPKTRSSSRNPRCLLLYNNLFTHTHKVNHQTLLFFVTNWKINKWTIPVDGYPLLLFVGEINIKALWTRAEESCPQINSISKRPNKKDPEINDKLPLVVNDGRKIILENRRCNGRGDGAPSNHRGGADDPVDVNQSFSAGHFFCWCSLFSIVSQRMYKAKKYNKSGNGPYICRVPLLTTMEYSFFKPKQYRFNFNRDKPVGLCWFFFVNGLCWFVSNKYELNENVKIKKERSIFHLYFQWANNIFQNMVKFCFIGRQLQVYIKCKTDFK